MCRIRFRHASHAGSIG
ncbi:MAG: hypothetical protein JSR94_03755 [Proteobacteria bacterium]|nr:hypothetical protein [Pseudomonadota bacterium]